MKKHILLVDEDRAGLHNFLQAIQRAQLYCKCTYAASCTHALQMLEYLTPDSLFIRLDPDIAENLEYIRNIKNIRRLYSVPIVVYCPNMQYYRSMAFCHGADDCIEYSYAPENIIEALQRLFSLEPGHSPDRVV